jgi:hypothetical protein
VNIAKTARATVAIAVIAAEWSLDMREGYAAPLEAWKVKLHLGG